MSSLRKISRRRGSWIVVRAVAFISETGKRITIVALLNIALAGAGYGFVLVGSDCPGAAPTAGLAPGLAIEPPTDLGAGPVVSSQLGRHGPVAYHNRLNDRQCCLVIAHAGGSVDGLPYTNSREALDRNYSLGRRVFEIDFSETCDGSLVLLHDWNMTGGDRLSKARFLEAKGREGFSRLDLDGLASWLLQKPDSIIVTDTKGDFDRFFRRLEERLPPWFIERYFVIQVYDPATLDRLRQAKPSLRLVLTIYKMTKVSDESLAQTLAHGGVVGLTMPRRRAFRSLPVLRKQFPDLPMYVHGSPSRINAPELHARLAALGASGFYLE